jgi:hypothetical protein
LILLAKFVFGANFYTDAAYAAPANVLEIFLHVSGAFFGVKITFAIRGRGRAEDCACGTSRLTSMTISAAIFDDGELI